MVKFDIKPSLHTLPIDLRDLDCRWGNICGVLDAWVKRGLDLVVSYGWLV